LIFETSMNPSSHLKKLPTTLENKKNQPVDTSEVKGTVPGRRGRGRV